MKRSLFKSLAAAPFCLAAALLLPTTDATLASGFTGKVIETTNASSYTYVQVDTGTTNIWAAANRFPVQVGDVVTIPDAEPMVNFQSPTLNRSFPLIYFAGRIQVAGAKDAVAELPTGHPPIGEPSANVPAGHPPLASAATPARPVDFTGLKPAPGGRTVEQIFADSSKLAGQNVTLRGKVVKYNAEILDKNWLHIQDGTGGPGRNDILVTTSAVAKVGDTVLIEGKVAVNRDFGAGYKYNLLIEEAKVTVE